MYRRLHSKSPPSSTWQNSSVMAPHGLPPADTVFLFILTHLKIYWVNLPADSVAVSLLSSARPAICMLAGYTQRFLTCCQEQAEVLMCETEERKQNCCLPLSTTISRTASRTLEERQHLSESFNVSNFGRCCLVVKRKTTFPHLFFSTSLVLGFIFRGENLKIALKWKLMGRTQCELGSNYGAPWPVP